MAIVQLDRRTLLRGLGTSLLLPFLPSALPRRAWAGTVATPPRRLVYLYKPNGFAMDRWAPTGMGASWVASPTLQPVDAHRDDLLILSGIDNLPGNAVAGDAPAGAHFQQTGSILTATHVEHSSAVAGVSADQIAAQAFGYVTPYRSLQLSLSPGGSGGSCGSGWPCAYLQSVSWQDATTPLANQSDPQGLFQLLFSGSLGMTEAEFEARRARKLGVLDTVAEDAKQLSKRLGAADRAKLDQYLTAVYEAEARTDALTYGLTCDPGMAPPVGATYVEKLEAMLDVLVLALECDITRVATVMTWAGGASHGIPYDWVSVDGSPVLDTFHTVSHHGGDPDKLAAIEAINIWEMTVFAGLLDRMKAVVHADGSTLLDQSAVCFLSEVSDGDSHTASNLPVLIGGHAGGTLDTGRYDARSAPDNTLADLHLALLESVGVSTASLGDDGTAPMGGILI
ncbi:MAG: DUF1552 domain-containing protein [Myxococcota bacterium]